jgi:selenocysteine-specific elongation factor
MARLRPLGRQALEPGATGPAQLRLERPVAALPGDRFVLRRYSPLCTLGGGVLVDLDPPKARRGDPEAAVRAERLAGASPRDRALVLVDAAGESGWEAGRQMHRLGLAPRTGAALLAELVAEGALAEVAERYILPAVREDLAAKIEAAVREYHERQPLEEGMLREVLRSRTAAALPPDSFRTLLRGLEEKGRVRLVRDAVAAPDHRSGLTPEQETITRKILTLLLEAGLEPPAAWTLLEQVEDRKEGERLLRYLEKEGRIIRLGDGRYFHGQPVEALRRKLRERARRGEETIDVPAFKRLAGVTRKSAIPLLERFDAEQLTVRRGDLRVIRDDS